MTYGRQPRVNEEINWVTDEDGNVLGFMKDARTFVPIAALNTDPLTGKIAGLVGPDGAQVLPYLGVTNPAFMQVMTTLKEGLYSPSITVMGDSTGFPDYQWPRKLADKFAADFPSLRVQYQRFNDATQDYDATVVVAAGAGERSVRFTGVKGRYQPAADVGDWTTDLDLRAKISMDNWNSGTQQSIISRLNSTNGQKAFNFYQFFGTLRLDVSVDGSATSTATSSIAPTVSAGQTIWVRSTYTSADGSVRFYTGTDGVNWTQLGTTIASGVTGVLFKPASKDYEIGSMNGVASSGAGSSQLLTGNIYAVQIRDGIGGPVMNAQPIESWAYANGDGTSLAGAQTLYINNGSIPGATLAYLSNATRLKMLVQPSQPNLLIASCSHNDLAAITKSQLFDPWDAFLTALKARLPESTFAICTQNPKTSPALFIEAHGQRVKRLMTWAARNNVAVIDTYASFIADPRGLPALIDPADGIHPLSAGGDLWASSVYSRFVANKL